ncbi:bifunctional glutamate--cysteine ligase GshA/glutathione synthetase GshB [Paenibacillus sp. sptzw28]|uniref:bifunctional glutamate--cysteine ligase GshA/glutathione synthetase GshB n=1 Tax=Paenibacillus sp. sptzw28 TaxID=715179 RepID=UPI00216190BB|nr:bifunctional glutamate--cysteine ligase GshA/glutathione synthetase GshB [Paenibacillus sp. sptzw28]
MLTKLIEDNRLQKDLFRGKFGLEKENNRVDSEGHLALTPHPVAFGSKQENPYIKVDFSESQIEMVTPVLDSIEDTHNFLETLHDIVSLELQGEYLWPSSNPPALPKDEDIPIALMDNPEEDRYRQQLAEKYGRKRQLISGIHYNFSFDEEFIKKLYRAQNSDGSYKDFKDGLYLRVARNVLKYRWLLIYLTGASPVFNKTYNEQCVKWSDHFDDESHFFSSMNSLRNSICGYRNRKQLHVSYQSVKEYVRDIMTLVDAKELISVREYYSPVRLKPAAKSNDFYQELLGNGIGYLELRMIDLNPLKKIGISQETMRFIHLFLVYMLLLEDQPFDDEAQAKADLNHDSVIINGLMGMFESDKGTSFTFTGQAEAMFGEMKQIARTFIPSDQRYMEVLELEMRKIRNSDQNFAYIVKAEIQESSYLTYHLSKAKQYVVESHANRYKFVGYEDLELSTQLLLKAAIKRGIAFTILDRDDNFVVLKKGDRLEYVKQATKTSLDSYSTVLIMENKVVTKKVLNKHGIRVPKGNVYRNIDDAMNDFAWHLGNSIVIKPKSTNFGLGITIFKDSYSQEEYAQALEMAFSHDQSVLIEEFVSGKEYRFLVMGDEVVGVLHRVPANVIGDGIHTIEQLIEKKNQDPLRGKGYKTPLERIHLGDVERMFLKNQSRSVTNIPQDGEVVFLRENSNISTGGDSIDFTDDIPGSYKQIAVRSAQAARATFCGVDMMISDIGEEANETNYSIIEINFNPAIHIHCYPYKGINRQAEEKILELLFGR